MEEESVQYPYEMLFEKKIDGLNDEQERRKLNGVLGEFKSIIDHEKA